MGNKQVTARETSSTSSLNNQEKRRLTSYLESRGATTVFSYEEIKRLWDDLLVPDLLKCYADFLMKHSVPDKGKISKNEFVQVYTLLIRGDSEEKVSALAEIIGSSKNAEGQVVVSFKRLCKYLSDLLDSYFLGLMYQCDNFYLSWTNNGTSKPQRPIIEQIMRGVCNDLQRTNDEVRIDLLENWLNQIGLINVLHCYVLGSLYNLEPETESHIIPLAKLPTTHTQTLLDLSQVIYLNSFMPNQFRYQWRFIYSTATHGESFSKFAASIINQGPILLIVESNEHNIFGGYISTNVILGPKWTGSSESFLFQLLPTVDAYPATGYNDHYGYLNMNQTTLPNGLGMGGQYGYWGLWIDSQFGTGECSESCTTYKNYRMLNSSKKFSIKNLEVWGTGDPPPSESERGERSRAPKSALDVDPSAGHILEMSGRTMHSKGLREDSNQEENN